MFGAIKSDWSEISEDYFKEREHLSADEFLCK